MESLHCPGPRTRFSHAAIPLGPAPLCSLMKNNFIRVALLLALVLAFAGGARAQTNLAAGDIAIVGITRGSSPAKLSIVALRNISAGTKIYISDYGYDESTGVFGTASLTGTSSQAEGVITWTPSATVDAGTLYTIAITPHATSPSVSVLPGTVTVSGWSNTTASPISGGGDNWFIYQGSSPTSVKALATRSRRCSAVIPLPWTISPSSTIWRMESRGDSDP